MVFVTEKIKKTDKFNLDGLGAKRVVKKPLTLRAWQKICIALISGAILGFASPGFDQWWLAWFMVAPFLVMISFCHGNVEPLFVGLAFGLGYHLVSLQYYLGIGTAISGQSPARIAALIWFVQALELSLPTMLFAWFVSLLPLRPGYIPYFVRPFFPYLISVPLLWVFLHWGLNTADYLISLGKFLPVAPVATDPLIYSQYNLLPMLQILKYIGPVGLEFFLILVNSTIAAFIVELVKRNEGPLQRVDSISPRAGALVDLCVALIIAGALYYFGQAQIDTYVKQSKELGQYDKATERAQPILPVGIMLGDQFSPECKMPVVAKELPMIIFAEASKERGLSETNDVLNRIKDSARQNRNSIILSLARAEGRNIMRENLILSAEGSTDIKQHLYLEDRSTIPGGFLPDRSVRLSNILNLASLGSSLQEWLFVPNKEDPSSWYSLKAPKIKWGKLGLLSGSDVGDFRLVANEVRRGASLIVSSINLSWIHNSHLNKQMLAAGIFRAIENYRYVVICANEGVMAVIEPNGAVQSLFLPPKIAEQKKRDNNSDLLLGTVQFLWSKTPFTKTWWL